MEIDPRMEMAFNFASDLAKQLIVLSTGILALTISFTKDLVKNIPEQKLWTIKAAWITYFVSILCGVWTMSALTGQLAPSARMGTGIPLEIGWNIRFPAAIQSLSFLAATFLVILYPFLVYPLRKITARKEGDGGSDTVGKEFKAS